MRRDSRHESRLRKSRRKTKTNMAERRPRGVARSANATRTRTPYLQRCNYSAAWSGARGPMCVQRAAQTPHHAPHTGGHSARPAPAPRRLAAKTPKRGRAATREARRRATERVRDLSRASQPSLPSRARLRCTAAPLARAWWADGTVLSREPERKRLGAGAEEPRNASAADIDRESLTEYPSKRRHAHHGLVWPASAPAR